MYPLDQTDVSILRKIQEPTLAPPTRAKLAEQIKSPTHPAGHVAEHTLSAHIERLEDAGVITGYHASVDAEKIGLGFETFATLHLEKYSKADLATFNAAMLNSPYVLEAYAVGDRETDYLLKLATPTRKKYYETMQEFLDLPGVTRYVTFVILNEVKRTGVLSLAHLQDVPLIIHHRNAPGQTPINDNSPSPTTLGETA